MNLYQVGHYLILFFSDQRPTIIGVELGEISARFAHDVGDNGYMRLTNVRIPRNHMLMKLAQV